MFRLQRYNTRVRGKRTIPCLSVCTEYDCTRRYEIMQEDQTQHYGRGNGSRDSCHGRLYAKSEKTQTHSRGIARLAQASLSPEVSSNALSLQTTSRPNYEGFCPSRSSVYLPDNSSIKNSNGLGIFPSFCIYRPLRNITMRDSFSRALRTQHTVSLSMVSASSLMTII